MKQTLYVSSSFLDTSTKAMYRNSRNKKETSKLVYPLWRLVCTTTWYKYIPGISRTHPKDILQVSDFPPKSSFWGYSLHNLVEYLQAILKISLGYTFIPQEVAGISSLISTCLMIFLIHRQYPQDIPHVPNIRGHLWDIRNQYGMAWGYLMLCGQTNKKTDKIFLNDFIIRLNTIVVKSSFYCALNWSFIDDKILCNTKLKGVT